MIKILKSVIFASIVLLLSNVYCQELLPTKIFENNTGSVVVINCLDENGNKKAQGSGVILADKGIIITNFHVFAGSEKLEIKHNDTIIYYTEITGINIEKDIMVIKLLETSNFSPLSIGNLSRIKIGDKVYAIGSPLGLENTLSEGIISGIRTFGVNKRNLIQITASISAGSSGGAIFNSYGELIGISTSKMTNGENLNFMIPINEVLSVADSGLYDNRSIQALKYFYKGLNAYENGKEKEAIQNYTKYIEIVPKDSKAYNYRGLVYLNINELELAEKDFLKALEIDKNNTAALCNIGECFFKEEEYEKAESNFTKVLKIDSTYYYAYFARGLTYFKIEEYKKALNDYNIYLYHNFNNVTALINRGFVYYSLEDYQNAMGDWNRVINLDPSYEKSLRKCIDAAKNMLWQK